MAGRRCAFLCRRQVKGKNFLTSLRDFFAVTPDGGWGRLVCPKFLFPGLLIASSRRERSPGHSGVIALRLGIFFSFFLVLLHTFHFLLIGTATARAARAVTKRTEEGRRRAVCSSRDFQVRRKNALILRELFFCLRLFHFVRWYLIPNAGITSSSRLVSSVLRVTTINFLSRFLSSFPFFLVLEQSLL